jgi:hypothetical protein
MNDFTSEFEAAESLQNLLLSVATGGARDERGYQTLRKHFVDSKALVSLIPRWIRTNRDLSQFWAFIKTKFGSYAQRRGFIWSEFAPLLEHLEGRTHKPSDAGISTTLKDFSADGVHVIWEKALQRRESDTEGAITMAKTLLESVLKHILDNRGISYEAKTDLIELYRLTAKELSLAPEQHTEEVFKKILGSVSSIVNSLGTLRNRLGDAHGHGKGAIRPAQRHAGLAVNLAGSIALFLVDTVNKPSSHS